MIVSLTRVTLSVASPGHGVSYLHIPLSKSPNWVRVGMEITAFCSFRNGEWWVEEIQLFTPPKIIIPQETIVRMATPPSEQSLLVPSVTLTEQPSGSREKVSRPFSPLIVSPLEWEVQRLLPHYAAGVRFFNRSLPPHLAEGIAAGILRSSLRYGLDPRLVVALIACESSFRPDAEGKKGEIGLGQLLPSTAQALGVDPKNVLQNIEGSVRYLKAQLDRFGQIDLALAAYNAGPNAVINAGGIPQNGTTPRYVSRILLLYRQLCGR